MRIAVKLPADQYTYVIWADGQYWGGTEPVVENPSQSRQQMLDNLTFTKAAGRN